MTSMGLPLDSWLHEGRAFRVLNPHQCLGLGSNIVSARTRFLALDRRAPIASARRRGYRLSVHAIPAGLRRTPLPLRPPILCFSGFALYGRDRVLQRSPLQVLGRPGPARPSVLEDESAGPSNGGN